MAFDENGRGILHVTVMFVGQQMFRHVRYWIQSLPLGCGIFLVISTRNSLAISQCMGPLEGLNDFEEEHETCNLKQDC